VKLLLYSLLALLLTVSAGVWLSQDTGQVFFTFQDYTVQASLGFFIVFAVLVFLVAYALIRTVSRLIGIPENYRRWKKHRRHAKSEFCLTQGFLALVSGDWHAAEKFFTKGIRYSSQPTINYVGAARAAQHLGAIDRRDRYLRLAYTNNPDADYVAGITRAELQLGQQQTEQALATLQHLDAENPGRDQVKMLLLKASSELKDWSQALIQLQELERKGLLPAEKIRAGQLRVYSGLLSSAARSGDADRLDRAWQDIPVKLQREPHLLEVYVTERLQFPDTSRCEPLLRRALKKNPDPALVRLYGLIQGKQQDKQLAFAERLLADSPYNAVLQLTVARLSKRLGLWGKAKSCLEESLRILPTPEACHELADLFEQQGDQERAGRCYRQGLSLAVESAGPILPVSGEKLGPPPAE